MELISDYFYDNSNNVPHFDNNSDEVLLDLFSQLYQSFSPQEIIIPSNQKFLSQIKKKLFSNFKITKKDEPNIVNLLQDKASKISNFDPDTINHFQNLYHRLLHKRTLTKRWEVLYLLNSLSNVPKIYKQLDYSENDLLLNKMTNINCNISGNDIVDNENKFLNCKTKNTNEIDQSLNNKNNNSIDEYDIVVDPSKSHLNINEKDIVTDLLYVLVGIDGKYIKYDQDEDSFILDENIPWDESLYDVVYSISEVGWLYYKIEKYILFYKDSNIKSLYIQSLIFAIQNELDNYYKLVSLFKKINNNDLSGNIGHIPLNDSIEELKKYQKKLNLKNLFMGVITYREKLKWLLTCCEVVRTLKGSAILSQIYSYVTFLGTEKYLNNVLNEVSKPFIFFVLNWIKYGEIQDPYDEFFVKINDNIKDDDIWNEKYKLIWSNIPNFVKREPIVKIFEIGKCIHFIRNFCKEKYSLKNLKKIIQHIILKYSHKNENENQIVVKENDNKNNLNNNNTNNINMIKDEEESSTTEDNSMNEEDDDSISNTKLISEFDYGIDKDKIIFEIDSYKSNLNFISFIFSKSLTSTEQRKIMLNIGFFDEIKRNIDILHKLVNKDLIRIFFQKFKLIENLESLNKYLLLGQGDMIQVLMESLYDELKKPGNTIYKYVLQSVLESSINSTNARFNDKDCLNKLNIKLLNPRPGDIGWDIFCLEYSLSLPLNNIINSKNIIDYQKMFIFLLKIKRIEYSQEHQEWRKIMTYCHQMQNENYNYFRKKMQRSLQFNQEIIHFITSLHNYLTLEVLETQYKKLLKKMKIVNNLDELIAAHDEFINNIKQKCFLDNNDNDNLVIYKKIISIFDIILRFRTAHDVLVSTLLQKFHDANEEKSLNDNEEDENEDNINYEKRIDESIKQITFLYEEFKNKIIELINIMKGIGKDLDYLAMKIDFNYYYSMIEKEKEEKEQQLVIENLIKEEQRLRYEKKKEKENLYRDNDDYVENDFNDNDNNNNDSNLNKQNINYNNNDSYNTNNNYDNNNNNNYNDNNYNDNNDNNYNYNDNNYSINNNENSINNDNNNFNINIDNNNYNINNYNINNDHSNENSNMNYNYNLNNNTYNDGNDGNSYNYNYNNSSYMNNNNINNENYNDENNNSYMNSNNDNYYYNKYNINNINNNDYDNESDKKYSGDEGMEEDEKNDNDNNL